MPLLPLLATAGRGLGGGYMKKEGERAGRGESRK